MVVVAVCTPMPLKTIANRSIASRRFMTGPPSMMTIRRHTGSVEGAGAVHTVEGLLVGGPRVLHHRREEAARACEAAVAATGCGAGGYIPAMEM
jgi:hypothetical protein